jgi:hypothetical protein
MILEEINGDVKVIFKGQPLSLGSTVEDADYSLIKVFGEGRATFRIDPSCTVDVKGVEILVATADESAPAPVEIQLTAESTVKAVEAPVKVVSKAPTAE